ncbi:hypothetical protein J7295_01517 [Nakaseomyces glabratus]|nr:hypothetical protein J7298_01511 [Nakaseomyces glabratus]KAH7604225.1 hypothetical protein J7295_01517 [Nakaseomyces glabratus]KAH7614218.1 hypothetical protein J7292_01492 [Nakaseomyces glabratus]
MNVKHTQLRHTQDLTVWNFHTLIQNSQMINLFMRLIPWKEFPTLKMRRLKNQH